MVKSRKGLLKAVLGLGLALPGIAAADNTNAVIDSLTSNTNINWGWDIESYQQVDAAANGSVTGTGSGWYRVGSVVSNNAVADEHYEFSGWSGSGVEPGQENANPLVRTSTRDPKVTTANFTPKLNSHGTPYPWAAMYYGNLSESQLDTMLAQDTDGDGHTGNEEFTADTNPTLLDSVFYTSIKGTGVNLHNTSTGRVYGVSHKTNIMEDAWNVYTNGIFGNGSNITVEANGPGVYQGTVSKPEE